MKLFSQCALLLCIALYVDCYLDNGSIKSETEKETNPIRRSNIVLEKIQNYIDFTEAYRETSPTLQTLYTAIFGDEMRSVPPKTKYSTDNQRLRGSQFVEQDTSSLQSMSLNSNVQHHSPHNAINDVDRPASLETEPSHTYAYFFDNDDNDDDDYDYSFFSSFDNNSLVTWLEHYMQQFYGYFDDAVIGNKNDSLMDGDDSVDPTFDTTYDNVLTTEYNDNLDYMNYYNLFDVFNTFNYIRYALLDDTPYANTFYADTYNVDSHLVYGSDDIVQYGDDPHFDDYTYDDTWLNNMRIAYGVDDDLLKMDLPLQYSLEKDSSAAAVNDISGIAPISHESTPKLKHKHPEYDEVQYDYAWKSVDDITETEVKTSTAQIESEVKTTAVPTMSKDKVVDTNTDSYHDKYDAIPDNKKLVGVL